MLGKLIGTSVKVIGIIAVVFLVLAGIPSWLGGHNPYEEGTGHYAGWEYAARGCYGVSGSFIEGCEEQKDLVHGYWLFVVCGLMVGAFILGGVAEERRERKRLETVSDEGAKEVEYAAIRRKHLEMLQSKFSAEPSAESLMNLFRFRPGLRTLGNSNVEEAVVDVEKQLPEIAILRAKNPLEFKKFVETLKISVSQSEKIDGDLHG